MSTNLARVIGHANRVVPLHDYCTGLLLPGKRKSVEPHGNRAKKYVTNR